MILIKQNGPIAPKIINELPSPTNQLLVTQMLSKAKKTKNYQNRKVINEFEQALTKLISETVEVLNNANEMLMQPPIAPAPKYVKARSFDKADAKKSNGYS